jgi:nitrogen fixation protein FixH
MSPDGRVLSVRLPPGHGADARGTVTLYRPSDSRADQIVRLSVDASGAQQVALTGLAAGRWRVQVEWEAGETPYYYEQTMDIR